MRPDTHRPSRPTTRSLVGLAWLAGLVVVLTIVPTSVAGAREDWVPSRYRALIDASNERVDRAEALEADDPARVDLVLEAVRLRQSAAAMLRDALLSGVIEEYYDQAQADYFVLEEYIAEKLLELSRCDEAHTQIENALSEPLLLPVGGLAELESLRAETDDCLSASEPEASAVAEAPPMEAPGPETVPVEEEPPPETTTAAREEPVEETAEDEEPVPVEPAPERRSRRIVPWVLIGSGGALLVGALACDISLGGDRDELDALNSRCSTENCTVQEIDRGHQLVSDLDGARWIVGGLAIAGLAAGTVGLVLLLKGDDSPESSQVSLVPDGPGELGASLRVTF